RDLFRGRAPRGRSHTDPRVAPAWVPQLAGDFRVVWDVGLRLGCFLVLVVPRRSGRAFASQCRRAPTNSRGTAAPGRTPRRLGLLATPLGPAQHPGPVPDVLPQQFRVLFLHYLAADLSDKKARSDRNRARYLRWTAAAPQCGRRPAGRPDNGLGRSPL